MANVTAYREWVLYGYLVCPDELLRVTSIDIAMVYFQTNLLVVNSDLKNFAGKSGQISLDYFQGFKFYHSYLCLLFFSLKAEYLDGNVILVVIAGLYYFMLN